MAAGEEKKRYFYRSYLGHLHDGEEHAEIDRTLEETAFLARQADFFAGFRASGRDLEDHALPSAIARNDWQRFLRYALLALNLRGLVESLAEDDILFALARGGQGTLARDAVAGLHDPVERAAARAVIAAAGDGNGDEVADELNAAPPPEDHEAAARQARHFGRVAHWLGPKLAPSWTAWLARLKPWPDLAAQTWQAVAESLLDAGELDAPVLRQALAEIGDSRKLAAFLPRRLEALLARSPSAAPESLLEDVWKSWPREPELLWLCRFVLLNHRARSSPERAFESWREWRDHPPPPYSVELITAAREFLAALDPRRLETLAASLHDPALVAALRVTVLEARPEDPEAALAALAAVQQAPPRARLHWSLRYLGARPPSAVARRRLEAVWTHVVECRFAVPESDLVRAFDLLARHFPARVRREIDRAVASTAVGTAALLVLAREASEVAVLQGLARRAERYAAVVSDNEAAGFELRGELLTTLAARLALGGEDSDLVDDLRQRLLPAEEDELGGRLAPLLAAGDRGAAAREAEGIRCPRLRLLTSLRVRRSGLAENPAAFDEIVRPSALYEAMADVGTVRDEELARAVLDGNGAGQGIDRPEIRSRALLWAAGRRQALELARGRFSRDRSAAIEEVRHEVRVEDLGDLVALTPALLELGATRGKSWAVDELREAIHQLQGFEDVAWATRRQALEDVLVRLAPALISPPSARSSRRLAAVFREFFELPVRRGENPAPRHWWEAVPLFLAVLDRLPDPVERILAGSRCRRGWLQPYLGAAGGESMEPIAEICLAPTPEHVRLAREATDHRVAEALAYLLVSPRPREIPPLIARLAAPDGDELGLRLIRHGWLPLAVAAEICESLHTPAARLEARLWQGLRHEAEDPAERGDWLNPLTELLADHGVDPSPALVKELPRRLRAVDPERGAAVLAQAVRAALGRGDRRRGEAALRLWLYTRPAVEPELENVDAARVLSRAAELRAA